MNKTNLFDLLFEKLLNGMYVGKKKTLFDMPSESGVKNSLLPGVSKKTHMNSF